MGKVTGFLEFDREDTPYRPVETRLRDWNEVQADPSGESVQRQAARCMDCGVPFCNNGCPLGNLIPDGEKPTCFPLCFLSHVAPLSDGSKHLQAGS